MKMTDEQLEKSWMLDQNIVKRSFAVLGHFWLAYLMVLISIFAIAVILAGIVAIFE